MSRYLWIAMVMLIGMFLISHAEYQRATTSMPGPGPELASPNPLPSQP